jgi:putative transposase
VKYHVVWITKYRYKVLRGEIAVRTRDLLRQICEGRKVVIVQGAVSPDHVHMLGSVPPQLAPAKLVQYMKGRSSRLLQDEFPELKKRYWGQHLWARGYFCASVGAVDEETIRKYIESQQMGRPWGDLQNHRAKRALRRLSAVSLAGGFSRKQATSSRNQTHRLIAVGRLDET